MTDQADFLREIIAAPDDDAPRLIYADWLEEQDDPRGEFIRVQCEMDRTPWHEPRYIELEDRERELLSKFGNKWTNRLPPAKQFAWGTVDTRYLPNPMDREPRLFRRGMPEVGRVKDVAAFLEETEPNLGRTLLREIRLYYDLKNQLQPFLSAWGERLRGLHLYSTSFESANGFRVVTESPAAEHLRSLSFEERGLDKASLETMLRSHWPNLRQLKPGSNRFGSQPARLADWKVLPQLAALNLSGNNLGPNCATIFAPGRMSQIHALDLSSCGLDDSALETLARAKLHRLTHLSLSDNLFAGSSAAALFQSAAFPALRVLFLCQPSFDDAAAAVMAECPSLATLTALYLGHTRLTSRGVSALARSPHIANLRLLSLIDVAVDDAAVNALVESPFLGRLKHIILPGTRLSPDGMQRVRARFDKPD